MPFASLNRPSLALTQLRSVLKTNFADKVETDIFYLNFDFAEYLELENSQAISESFAAVVSGLGDWFFSGVAFPDAPDQTEKYMQRHPAALYGRPAPLEALLKEKRKGISEFLDLLIDKHDLARYRVVGLTSTFQQSVACLALAKKLKERDPSIVTVMGGANCETSMGKALVKNFTQIDFTFSGRVPCKLPDEFTA